LNEGFIEVYTIFIIEIKEVMKPQDSAVILGVPEFKVKSVLIFE
jgi:hypothetical protein